MYIIYVCFIRLWLQYQQEQQQRQQQNFFSSSSQIFDGNLCLSLFQDRPKVQSKKQKDEPKKNKK